MSSHNDNDYDRQRDHYFIIFGGDSNFGFSDTDGTILGWIALILGVIFLIALLS